MNYKAILTKLFYLLVSADGAVNDYERTTGRMLAKAEGLNEEDLRAELETLKGRDTTAVLAESIAAIKKLSRPQQIRIVAWLCVVANGDGFMDKSEWQLIYQIYHRELNLPLEEIFKVQKELNRVSREKHLENSYRPIA